MAMDQLQVSRWIWRSWLLLLLLLLPCLSPAFATLEQGVALQEVKKSGWMSSVVVSHETWVVGTDPCVSVWEGVDCDTQGNVITLNLTNAGLRGPVPHALGRLTTLTHLDMGNNKICTNCSDWNRVTGDLAPVANLINLRFLCLTSNEMDLPNGPFPTAIYQLKQLINLRIDNTEIGGEFPAQLGTLHNLQYLYLGNNSFTGTIPRDMWASMMNLKELTMWGNQLTGLVPPELGNLVNLTYLNLNRNNLYGGLPPELGNLIHLKRLIMFRNKFTGPIPDAWRGMTSLENLQLNSNFVYGKLPSWLLQIPSLSFLELSINQIRGPIVPVLNYSTSPGLKTLFLQCNYFEGVRPKVEINITTNFEYNCWVNETLGDAACERILNCQSFILHTMDGKCPNCPIGQKMVNTTTCICHGVPKQSSKRQLGVGAIVGIFAGAVLLVSLVVASLLWRAKRQAKKQHQDPLLHPDYFQANKEGGLVKRASISMEVPRGVQHFTMEELMKATNGFDKANEIGEGGFGKVFIGYFPGGRTLAIKKAGSSQYSTSAGFGQFRNEVLLLSRLHHKNLVRLEGFCDEGSHQILVYEYMKMGNLHSHLHGNLQGKYRSLDWYKRLEIALHVAQGLDYLHSFADPPVIHRDVKPSNILLDDHLVAKVADFGISKESPEVDTHVSTALAGTAGYFDPQYFLCRQLTTASDVYSFGVVLLELITGRKAITVDCPREEEANIIEWGKAKMEAGGGGIESIVDPNLEGNYPTDLFNSLLDLAFKCSSFKRNRRPTMKAVVSILEPLLQGAERPTQNNLPQLQLSTTTSSSPTNVTGESMTNIAAGDVGANESTISLKSSTRFEIDTVLFPR